MCVDLASQFVWILQYGVSFPSKQSHDGGVMRSEAKSTITEESLQWKGASTESSRRDTPLWKLLHGTGDRCILALHKLLPPSQSLIALGENPFKSPRTHTTSDLYFRSMKINMKLKENDWIGIFFNQKSLNRILVWN
jgi:hypothetical protein